jgi:hypothetical protein
VGNSRKHKHRIAVEGTLWAELVREYKSPRCDEGREPLNYPPLAVIQHFVDHGLPLPQGVHPPPPPEPGIRSDYGPLIILAGGFWAIFGGSGGTASASAAGAAGSSGAAGTSVPIGQGLAAAGLAGMATGLTQGNHDR